MVSDNASEARVRQLRSLLVPVDEHPAGRLIDLESSVAAMAADPLPAPWGMVWAPPSCQNYLEEAVPELHSLNGWVRLTDRRAKSFSHDNFYIDMVIESPGGVDVQRISRAAGTCSSGTLTLDAKVVGRVTYTELASPALADASTLTMQIQVQFEPPADRESAEILAKYGYVSARDADGQDIGVNNVKQVSYVATGDTLFMVLSPDPDIHRAMPTTLYQRARSAGDH
ncbi:hypothetical protein [Nonomuraea jiangxiensis]|uniref:Uncharacterized protein n=1 Tax=Nonomuraea jiangxiensis TaxID=633440 RepID=A0A1G9BHR2_9ACTN|nr:hypothetical protein [Nonomuraea jiangxiensis]SDK39042.1 hypothetical protein SAMN05421869_115265 [Nonomuraea jiangxiensis]